MKSYKDLVAECLAEIEEIFPWDLVDRRKEDPNLLILDVREPYEFDAMHIEGSLNVPRGILESACEYDYEETVPELVEARNREVVVVCRSGYRSVLAAYNMKQMGYGKLLSLKTGLRGWNDFEQPMVDDRGEPVDIEQADAYFEVNLRPEQLRPKA